ncbi:hypothetical protein ACN47E_009436 [Coniothyrium glycines]
MLLNEDAPEYGGGLREIPHYIPEEERRFDILHAAPVEGKYEHWQDDVDHWRHFQVDCNPLPDNLYQTSNAATAAAQVLIEYQDSVELDGEQHTSIEQWARPQLPVPIVEVEAVLDIAHPRGLSISPSQMMKNRCASTNIARCTGSPPGLDISLTEMEQNRKVLAHLGSLYSATSSVGTSEQQHRRLHGLASDVPSPPGLFMSYEQKEQNRTALANVSLQSKISCPPGLALCPAMRAHNKAALAAWSSDIPSPPGLLSYSPAQILDVGYVSSHSSSQQTGTFTSYPPGYYSSPTACIFQQQRLVDKATLYGVGVATRNEAIARQLREVEDRFRLMALFKPEVAVWLREKHQAEKNLLFLLKPELGGSM